MSGVGLLRARFTFWLMFSQSDILPLLFNGVLSYSIGMKGRTSRRVTCKRDNSHFLRYVLISPEAEILLFRGINLKLNIVYNKIWIRTKAYKLI